MTKKDLILMESILNEGIGFFNSKKRLETPSQAFNLIKRCLGKDIDKEIETELKKCKQMRKKQGYEKTYSCFVRVYNRILRELSSRPKCDPRLIRWLKAYMLYSKFYLNGSDVVKKKISEANDICKKEAKKKGKSISICKLEATLKILKQYKRFWESLFNKVKNDIDASTLQHIGLSVLYYADSIRKIEEALESAKAAGEDMYI